MKNNIHMYTLFNITHNNSISRGDESNQWFKYIDYIYIYMILYCLFSFSIDYMSLYFNISSNRILISFYFLLMEVDHWYDFWKKWCSVPTNG